MKLTHLGRIQVSGLLLVILSHVLARIGLTFFINLLKVVEAGAANFRQYIAV
jgi:hypothetical protein